MLRTLEVGHQILLDWEEGKSQRKEKKGNLAMSVPLESVYRYLHSAPQELRAPPASQKETD